MVVVVTVAIAVFTVTVVAWSIAITPAAFTFPIAVMPGMVRTPGNTGIT
jgi:hypothetical protein